MCPAAVGADVTLIQAAVAKLQPGHHITGHERMYFSDGYPVDDVTLCEKDDVIWFAFAGEAWKPSSSRCMSPPPSPPSPDAQQPPPRPQRRVSIEERVSVEQPSLDHRISVAHAECSQTHGVEDEDVEEMGEPSYETRDAKQKAAASHDSMGVISALLAGFNVNILTEVSVCHDYFDYEVDEGRPCTGQEGTFICFVALCAGLSTLVMLETALEYTLVMRELHQGAKSSWKLLHRLKHYRRFAEAAFVLALLSFLLATAMLLHIRFYIVMPVGALASISIVGACSVAAVVLMIMMKITNYMHNADIDKLRRRYERSQTAEAAPAMRKSKRRRSMSGFQSLLLAPARVSSASLIGCSSQRRSVAESEAAADLAHGTTDKAPPAGLGQARADGTAPSATSRRAWGWRSTAPVGPSKMASTNQL